MSVTGKRDRARKPSDPARLARAPRSTRSDAARSPKGPAASVAESPAAPVGRGGGKLEAAIARFGLAEAVRGARAVDVGASTGGFTQVLLGHGAAQVLAVDVGRDQLHEALRRDPRVESLEGTDWKRLALSIAPGLFDFFSVDVSFVAARSMLRSLAFRLRDGAEGVVLVKPQFELPDALVKGGDVSDPGLRARALQLFRTKAEALGFSWVEAVDSPVAGGSGTIEILAHLRFEGRTERLPAPGESRGQTPRAAGRTRTPTETLTFFAVAAPGLEEVVRAELAALPGARDLRPTEGGVEFRGPLEVGQRANLHLRVASRVLVRLGTVRAREFGKLRRLLAKLPWDALVPAADALEVRASASRCRLYHTGAIAETVALGIADRVGARPLAKRARTEGDDDAPDGRTRDEEPRPGDDDPDQTHASVDAAARLEAEGADEEPVTRVLLRGREDEWTISVDTSGALLHRRGYRLDAGAAPLRETLAAGLLALCGHDAARPFVDGMCGAGTIALEAASRALVRAPGVGRRFAFERWPGFDASAWARLVDEARATARPSAPAPLYAFDRDPRAIALATRNAARAGLDGVLAIEEALFGSRAVAGDSGLVVLNPPYGRRLGTRSGAVRLYREIGRALRARFPGWRAGVLVPDRALLEALGLRPRASHALFNGGLRVQLVLLDVPTR